jgi:hypothetical protein
MPRQHISPASGILIPVLFLKKGRAFLCLMSREKAVKENETSIAGPASGRGNIVKKEA